MEKINLVELLKNCPKGMRLACTTWENVTFEKVVNDEIYIKRNNKTPSFDQIVVLNKYGCCTNHQDEKCRIFPKGMNTWDGFVPPCQFKDGDILATDLGSVFILNTHRNTNECYGCYAGVCCEGVFYINEPFAYKECCNLATKEEREELFQTIKDNGYKWNAETKTLETLVKPTFKAGNKIKHKENAKWICTIRRVEDRYYVDGHPTRFTILFSEQDKYELVPNKFDINALKTFDQVLVRLSNSCIWMPKFFYYYDTDSKMKYYSFITTDNTGYPQCIPYNGNEHLCRTTNNCDEFYRVWEK